MKAPHYSGMYKTYIISEPATSDEKLPWSCKSLIYEASEKWSLMDRRWKQQLSVSVLVSHSVGTTSIHCISMCYSTFKYKNQWLFAIIYCYASRNNTIMYFTSFWYIAIRSTYTVVWFLWAADKSQLLALPPQILRRVRGKFLKFCSTFIVACTTSGMNV